MPPPDALPPPAQAGGMWGTISNVLTSGNAVFILAAIVVLVILFGVFAKLGVINIHKKGVKIGSRPDALGERFILRKQIDFIRNYAASKEYEIRSIIEENVEGQTEEYRNDPEYYLKWVLEMSVSYMITNWVMLNNITPDHARNMTRTRDLRLFISSLSGNGEYDKRVLEKHIDAWGAEIIEGLYRIRMELSGKM